MIVSKSLSHTPGRAMVNRGVLQQERKSLRKYQPHGKPGEGKTDRVSESELSMKLRYSKPSARTVDYDGIGTIGRLVFQ